MQSQEKNNVSMTFFERLKTERKRLKLKQSALAEAGGVTTQSQIQYEKGRMRPSVTYLEAIARAGVDVLYVLTGERSDMALSPEERDLLRLYRGASLPGKAAAVAALTAGGMPTSSHLSVHIGGDNKGHIAGQDIAIRNTSTETRR